MFKDSQHRLHGSSKHVCLLSSYLFSLFFLLILLHFFHLYFIFYFLLYHSLITTEAETEGSFFNVTRIYPLDRFMKIMANAAHQNKKMDEQSPPEPIGEIIPSISTIFKFFKLNCLFPFHHFFSLYIIF